MLVVRRPLQTADLLPVAGQPTLGHHGRSANVALQNVPVSTAGAEDVAIPGERTDSRRMALQIIYTFICNHVPDLCEFV